MPYIKAQFGELNTELSPHVLPSGTADISTNVTIREGRLAKRAGFKKDSAVTTVIRMMQGPDGLLYTRTTVGWFYVWGNRLYFFNATRGIYATSADFATSMYAGLPIPTVGPAVTNVAGGTFSKQGLYRIYYSYYNSVTGEEGMISLPQHSWRPLESRWGGIGGGSIIVSGWADVTANYDYDKIRIYCTNGGTEEIMEPGFSQEAFLEADVPEGDATYVLYVPDMYHGSLSYPRYRNAGGLPPACTVGVYDGSQAIYCLASGKVEFSIPNQPTMIPRRQIYTDTDVTWAMATWSQAVEPLPWRGEIPMGLPSPAVAACFGAGRILIFTERQTIEMLRAADSRLVPRILDPHRGCLGAQACIGTAETAHVLSNEQWLVITRNSIRDSAKYHWSPTLTGIGSGAVVAHFSYDHQIWLADGADPSVIYIIDDETGHLMSTWTVAGIGTVQAMCEYTVAGSTPVMKIATDTGMWTYDPNDWAAQYEDNTTAFAAQWQGYFGTERLAYDQTLTGVRTFMYTNTSIGGSDGQIALAIRGLGRDITPPADHQDIVGVGRADGAMEFDENRKGNYFQVSITSSVSQARSWAIDDLIMEYTALRP